MKNVMLIWVSTMLGILSVLLVMTMYGRISRSMELQSILPTLVEESVDEVMQDKTYPINSSQEFVAEFVESLVYTLDSQSDLQIDVWMSDAEKGLLSVKVRAIYQHPNGKMGSADCERTVIFEPCKREEKPNLHTVTFYVGDSCYKMYQIRENSVINEPAEPKKEGFIFYGWVNEDGTRADIGEPVIQDEIYYADFRE